MHLDGRTRSRFRTAANRSFRWLAILFPFSIVGSVLGQGYLVPAPGFQGAPPVPTMGHISGLIGDSDGQINSQSTDKINALANGEAPGQTKGQPNAQPNGQANPEAEGEPSSGAAAAPLTAPLTSLSSWGALHLHARASYQFVYATGIHTDPGDSADTITHTITPGVTLNLGPHVTFDYSPSIRFYSKKDFHDTVDHSLSLNGGVNYGDWTFGTTHGFVITDDPLVETSTQTQQKSYSGSLFASYQVNDKVSLVTSASTSLQFVGSTNTVFTNGVGGSSALADSQSVSGDESLNYRFDERISTGVGVTIGYSQQDHGLRSVNEQYDVHADWHPGDKLSAHAMVGIERRHFLNVDNGATDWNPIYSANVGYRLFEHTALSLYANRTLGSSLFQRTVTDNTAVGLGLQQRLLGKLQLSLGFGYSKSIYQTATTHLSTTRSDEGTSYSAGLTLPFLTHCNFSTFYQYGQSSSSANGFGYSSSQAGMTVSWAY